MPAGRSRFRDFLPDVLAACTLCVWLAAKLTLFDALEYTSDLISNTQLSLSVFQGRPLLWDNGFGDHKALHNYYLNPLLAPFTWSLGPIGLFVASALLWMTAAFALFSVARGGPAWKRCIYWGISATFLFGPVGFWFFDDYLYGWHAEYLYLPLGIMFACALARGSRASWWIAGILLLVREEGALIVWAIHVLSEWLRPLTPVRARLVRIARITAVWALAFIAGLALLFLLRPAHGGARALNALGFLNTVVHDPALTRALIWGVEAAAAVMGCGVIVAVSISWRTSLAALVTMIPLLPPLLVAACAYDTEFGLREYGFSWGPRLVILWPVLAAALVLSSAYSPDRAPRHRIARAALLGAAILTSLIAQGLVLQEYRSYPFFERVTAFLPARRHRFVLARLRADEDALLRCLGRSLPSGTPVSSGGSLFARFSRQDIVWPDRTRIAWVQPQLVVCEVAHRLQYEYGCTDLADRLEASGFRKFQLGDITITYAEPLRPWIAGCAAGR